MSNAWKTRNPDEPRLRLIAQATAEVLGLRVEDLKGRDRRGGDRATHARQLAHLIARRLTTRSLQDIGHYIGGMHNTSVLGGIVVTEQRLTKDKALREAYVRIRALVKERHAVEVAKRPAVPSSPVETVPAVAGGAG